MKILRILTKSGHTLDLFLDDNGEVCYLKVSNTNELTPFSTIVELDLDEVYELLDFLEVKADEMELDDFLSPNLNRDVPRINMPLLDVPHPTEEQYKQYMDSFVDFPDANDIENWLNDESDED